MTVQVFRSFWGMTEPVAERIEKVAASGYDGVEIWSHRLPETGMTAAALREALAARGLRLIVMVHVSSVDELAKLPPLAEYQPVKIGMHSGRDFMSFDEGCRFFEAALRAEEALGLPVAHETHRGRLLFTPWHARQYLERFETLNILADFSHWVNVCERLPDDQADALDLAARHTIHIHGRIGYEQGPQVPDPSAVEYTPQREWHERHWRRIYALYRQRFPNTPLTFTPEYGPPAYLQTLPHTEAPVADLWRVCLWGKDRARELFRD